MEKALLRLHLYHVILVILTGSFAPQNVGGAQPLGQCPFGVVCDHRDVPHLAAGPSRLAVGVELGVRVKLHCVLVVLHKIVLVINPEKVDHHGAGVGHVGRAERQAGDCSQVLFELAGDRAFDAEVARIEFCALLARSHSVIMPLYSAVLLSIAGFVMIP